MADKTAVRDAEFTEWLAARQPSLLRTAYFLSGDLAQAEDVLQASLVKLYRSWDRVRQRDSVDAYMHRNIVNENNSLRRRGWRRNEYVSDQLPEREPEAITLATISSPSEVLVLVNAVIGTDCANGGCRVLVSKDNVTTTEVTADGVRDLPTSRTISVSDVSPGGELWAVSFAVGDGGQYGCVGLVDGTTGKVSVLDQDLCPVGTHKPANGKVISMATWADDTHVLAVVVGLQDNRWTVVRVGLGGQDPEVIAGPVAGVNAEMGREFLPSL